MRRVVILFILSIIVLVGIWQLVLYLTQGQLVVSTNTPGAIITLEREKGHSHQTIDKDRPYTLPTGKYTVSVDGGSIGASEVVEVSAHSTTKVTINPGKATAIEPVSYNEAYNFTADSQQLFYIDRASQTLHRIDSSNNDTPVSPIRLKSVQWLRASYGVGQDNDGNIYEISSGKLSQLHMNIHTDKDARYSVSPNGDIYISSSSNVYRGRAGGTFDSIYKTEQASPSIYAADGRVVVLDTRESKSGKGETQMVEIKGDKTIKKDLEAYIVTWSPSGNLVAVEGDSGGGIYDDNLRLVQPLPNLSHLEWVDDNNLIYSADDQVWAMSTSGKSHQIGNTPLGASIDELSLSSDGYIYLSTSDGNSSGIKRLGIKGQTVSSTVLKLQSILPLSTDKTTISLINFKRPTLLVTPKDESQTGPQLTSEAASALQQLGFNPASLDIRLER